MLRRARSRWQSRQTRLTSRPHVSQIIAVSLPPQGQKPSAFCRQLTTPEVEGDTTLKWRVHLFWHRPVAASGTGLGGPRALNAGSKRLGLVLNRLKAFSFNDVRALPRKDRRRPRAH
jgi:hypothetical protein